MVQYCVFICTHTLTDSQFNVAHGTKKQKSNFKNLKTKTDMFIRNGSGRETMESVWRTQKIN